MYNSGRDIENAVDFSRGRAEIRVYDWRREWNGVRRARPEMYILELNLSHNARAVSPAHSARHDRVFNARELSDVSFIPPDSKVQRDITPGSRRALLCMFDRVWLDTLLPRSISGVGSDYLESTDHGRSEWLLRNIYREMRQEKDSGSAIVIESFANALAVELARRLASRRTEHRLRKGGLAPWRMRLLKERIFSDAAAPSLTELAALCSMTVRHLCRAFKTETGITPGQYIDAARAQHARTLLSDTNLSFTDIAHRLGFATSTSFSKAFQRTTGLKPRQIERPPRSALQPP
jgi:AraC family transcriptional regulator